MWFETCKNLGPVEATAVFFFFFLGGGRPFAVLSKSFSAESSPCDAAEVSFVFF